MDIKYIAIVCTFLLLIFMLFKEYKRPEQQELLSRLIASVIAVVSFLLLIIPIHYQVSQTVDPEEISFLTNSTNPDSVTQKSKLFTSDSSVLKVLGKKINFIADLNYYLASHSGVKTIHLYGEGLDLSVLESLKPRQLIYHTPPLPSGIQSCNWNRKINHSEELSVQGVYENLEHQSVKLMLRGLGTDLDSLEIKPQSKANFDLKVNPKQIGRAVYQLIAMKAKDTLVNEAIPFEVKEKKSIRVLILASAPGFEYKFLKNWLLQNQYPVAYRSRISKDKFSVDFLNIKSVALSNINAQVLKDFDLIIADDKELADLKASEVAALANQIANGRGLLIRLDDEKLQSNFAKQFSLSNAPIQKDKSYVFSLSGKGIKTEPLPISASTNLNEQVGDLPLVRDADSKIWTNSQLYGAGKMILTAIPNTYNWYLSGNNTDYSSYWSTLMKNAVTAEGNGIVVNLSPQFPQVNHRLNILVESGNQLPLMNVGSVSLAPLQNKLNPSEWEGTYWPQKVGWDSVKVNSTRVNYFYVDHQNSWESLKQIKKIEQTLSFVKRQESQNNRSQTIQETEEREVSKWWFFFLFLLSAGFLWFEQRLI
nr:hypothetical protein [Pseudopedobacter sp.]